MPSLVSLPWQLRRAVKMLRTGASAQDREEFLREAEVMLRLGFNENLVRARAGWGQ